MISFAIGMRQCLGLFLPPVTHDLGLTAADYTFGIAAQNIAWGVAQTPVGAIADKVGLRPVLLFGAVLYVAAMVVMALASGVPALTLSGILTGVSIACTGSSLAMTATARVASRRSAAPGHRRRVFLDGTLLIAPLLQFLLKHWDWRVGVALFIVLALVMVPAAHLAGAADRVPQPVERRASMGEVVSLALRNRPFIVLCITYFVCGLQLIFLNTHLPNYLALCGQDPMLSATALAVIGGVNIAGGWLAGWLGGRYKKNVLLGLTYLGVTGTDGLLHGHADADDNHRLRRRDGNDVAGCHSFGVRLRGRVVWHPLHDHDPGTVLRHPPDGSVLGAWGGGVIFDAFGSYDLAWRVGVLIGIIAGVVQIVFGGPARQKGGMRPVLATVPVHRHYDSLVGSG